MALVSTCGWSQTQLGTVFGTITDQTGAVITGAQITVSSVSTGLQREARTDIKGQYQDFVSPEAGVDEIEGWLDGLRTRELRLIYTSYDRASLLLSTGRN
jgi:hypothetical protein